MPTSVLELIGVAAARMARTRNLDPLGAATILGVPQVECDDVPRLDTPEQLGSLYENALGSAAQRDRRKRAGTYYTAPALIAPTVARTLQPALANGRSNVTVCDPAAGGGAFLVAALRALAGASPTPPERRIALDSVFGVDRDASAVRVARLTLWLEVADPHLDPRILEQNVRHGDALLGASGRFPDDSAPRPTGSRPFDWPTAFPAVFAAGGFGVVIGNPPWDIHKPDSRRFFGAVDPEYPRLAKQDALALQHRLLAADKRLAEKWQRELDDHTAFNTWVRASEEYSRQGRGDANHYKLFLERAWNLLRDGGRLGMIIPSGIYTDAGCRDLRRMLTDEGQWEWLFGFENRRRIFPIDGRFKFAVAIAEKGGVTRSIQTAFMRTEVEDWERPDPPSFQLTADDVRQLSPRHGAILELAGARDLAVLRKIDAHAVPFSCLLENGLDYRREVDQTMDAARFAPRTEWEDRGFEKNEHSEWRHAQIGTIGVPFYEGRMIGQFECSGKGWVEGRGRRAVWRAIDCAEQTIEPQFVIDRDEVDAIDPRAHLPKIGFMAIGSATNSRTMIAASLIGTVCGNSVPTLRSTDLADDLCVLAVLNSFVFDHALRIRMGGTNLNQFVLAETPMLPRKVRDSIAPVVADVASLSWTLPRYDDAWRALGRTPEPALDELDRLARRCRIDAVVAAAFGLSVDDLAWILRDCEHDMAALQSQSFTRTLDQKGFWRIDRARAPSARHSVLVKRAFTDLCERIEATGSMSMAVEAFCSGSTAWSLEVTVES